MTKHKLLEMPILKNPFSIDTKQNETINTILFE
jgi:hypothetical protein